MLIFRSAKFHIIYKIGTLLSPVARTKLYFAKAVWNVVSCV